MTSLLRLITYAVLLGLLTGLAAPRKASDVPTLSGASHSVPRPFFGVAGTVSEVGSDAPYPAGPRLSVSDAPLVTRRISGLATWYCGAGSPCTRGTRPGQFVAAIDSDLGFRKGQLVRVSAFGRSVVVRLVDVCGCPGDRLIDLSHAAFSRLANPLYGVIPVMLELASGPVPTAPTTSIGGSHD